MTPAKLNADDLKAFCLQELVVAAIGVPPDVQALYNNLEPVIDPFWDDEDEEEDPEGTEDADDEEDTNVEEA